MRLFVTDKTFEKEYWKRKKDIQMKYTIPELQSTIKEMETKIEGLERRIQWLETLSNQNVVTVPYKVTPTWTDKAVEVTC